MGLITPKTIDVEALGAIKNQQLGKIAYKEQRQI